MAEKKTEQPIKKTSRTIEVRVSDFEHGLRVFDNVNMVRIASKDYNLLIMDDFIPTVGVLNGSVEIVSSDDLVSIKDVTGYYLNRKNVLTLLIDDVKKAS